MLWICAVGTSSPHEAHTDVRVDVAMILSCLLIDERTIWGEIRGGKSADVALRSSNSDSRRLTAERKAVETAALLVSLHFLRRGRSLGGSSGVCRRLIGW
jgi:hypothetical protein